MSGVASLVESLKVQHLTLLKCILMTTFPMTVVSIDPVLLSELQVYYTCTDPDYRNLLNRYKKEEAEAHLTHHIPLEQWTPMEGQPLTSSQLSMRSEAAATMSFYKIYVHTDRFHWKGSVLSEQVNQPVFHRMSICLHQIHLAQTWDESSSFSDTHSMEP